MYTTNTERHIIKFSDVVEKKFCSIFFMVLCSF